MEKQEKSVADKWIESTKELVDLDGFIEEYDAKSITHLIYNATKIEALMDMEIVQVSMSHSSMFVKWKRRSFPITKEEALKRYRHGY